MVEQNGNHRSERKAFFKQPLHLPWVWEVLLVGVLLLAGYLRFTGINWDANYHLHPDERFLTMVLTSIEPVDTLKEYFDTSTSTLNPNNRGFTFYVYGDLPIIIVRYVASWLGETGYDQIHLVGRILSGVFDLGTILFVYLIGKRLYKKPRLGLLAALFSAFAVLQIQLSHYFTVDNFANFFTYGAIYAAVRIITGPPMTLEVGIGETAQHKLPAWLRSEWRSFLPYALFGVLYGMAMASKVSIWALALILPLGAVIFFMKMHGENRNSTVLVLLRNLLLAGAIAFLAFRVFQPYAFQGPGFFGFKINENWLANLRELSNLSTGDIDVPYALQWARRPVTFTLQNLVLWGLGIPLGILSLAGLIWMTVRIVKGDWQKHAVIWGWTVFILVTQSLNWVRSMRYILPIYPSLALIAAWAVYKLWESGANQTSKLRLLHFNWRKVLAVTCATVTVLATAFWAFSFISIYQKTVTRVAASEWIYENVSGAINLEINRSEGSTITQPLAYQNAALVSSATPYIYNFSANYSGLLTQITVEHVLNEQVDAEITSLMGTLISPDINGGEYLSSGFFQSNFTPVTQSQGEAAVIHFQDPIQLEEGVVYQLILQVVEPESFLKLSGSAWLEVHQSTKSFVQYLPPPVFRLTQTTPYQLLFFPSESGSINHLQLNRVVDLLGSGTNSTLTATVLDTDQPEITFAVGEVEGAFSKINDERGEPLRIEFHTPANLEKGRGYFLQLAVRGNAELGIYNEVPVIESTWDDALPLSMYGYNQFDYWDGLYGNVRNLELYWTDNQEKLDKLELALDQSDAILISSNRQWGTIPRVPERYPLTSEYYRALLGCPKEKDILWCYSVAKPGIFQGELGFNLSGVFQNDPELFGISINDQFAEEAFTVYDHPKVLIFQKSGDYDQEKVRKILDAIDLSSVANSTPRQASKLKGNLSLSAEEQEVQETGGTWEELFPTNSVLNRSPWLAAVTWYIAVLLLGWLVYPLLRLLMPGLPDRGYAFSRLAGLLLIAYFTWLAGSLGGRFSRTTISVVLSILLLMSIVLGYFQRKEIKERIKSHRGYLLLVEAVFLVLFMVDLGIRIGNPDLWHPWKGGEKPMDLSYFTAVLKSSTFPPYDPWYSGGYINYYYYGFVIVGVLVKWLSIEPNIAYNLIIPTLFALTGIGAFGIGWNLFARRNSEEKTGEEEGDKNNRRRSLTAGLASAIAVLIIGNLGTLRMIWQGVQKLVAPGGTIEGANFFMHIGWFFNGLGKFLSGTNLPYGYGDWYWNPSRVIPGDVITEFPFFTFIYADLHAHMIALPITLLVIGWALSILLGRWEWTWIDIRSKWLLPIGSLLFGGLIISTLRPTNTWDLPTYTALAGIIIFYSSFKYAIIPEKMCAGWSEWLRRTLYALTTVSLLVGVTLLFYLPFTQKYGQAYGSISTWEGDHSPLGSYFVHWGWQLFLITSWFAWETREWLAVTPASIIKRFKPYFPYIQVVVVLFALVLISMTLLGIKIGWVVGLLGVWSLILMLRMDQPDKKRLVLFMTGTALLLTLFVELFALEGDIGRMNTVFKFYFQAWTLLSLSAAASFVWLIPAVNIRWKDWISHTWQICAVLLLFSAALFPITASIDKVRDRISTEAPIGLDGLAFMPTSSYNDEGVSMELNQDYQAILWMRENVQGSPVIVEANAVEYRWGNRFSIYTGLPGVLGWNWHQRQQRGYIDFNGITERLEGIPAFYKTPKIDEAMKFLDTYDVRYIIVGQMEQAYYPGEGLLKFEMYEGLYWKEVFRFKTTIIYEVMK